MRACMLRRQWHFLVVTLVGLSTLSLPPAAPAEGAGPVPAFDHIFTIVMENHNYDEVIGNTGQAPYVNSLADRYALAASYKAVSHPSLPNYLALTGGSTFGISDDCTGCYVSAPNLAVDRVEASGRSWKAYMESDPGGCFVGDSYPYMQKHDPFIYFDDVRTNPSECARVVPSSNLASDLASSATTPGYSWITPNMCDDTHDCSVGAGDAWLSKVVPMILSSPAYQQQSSLVLITWDEDDNGGNRVATLVIGKGVPAGFRSGVSYDHYSLLKTVETAWGLPPLTSNDAQASPMSDFFNQAPPPPAPAPAPALVPAPAPVPTAGGAGLAGAPTEAWGFVDDQGAVEVSWWPPADDGGCEVTGYTVRASPGNDTLTSDRWTTRVYFTGLTPGTYYTFTVTATNCAGDGAPSDPSNVVAGP